MKKIDERILRIDPESINDKIENFIKKKVEEAKATGIVIGLSGGIDSTTVVSLCKSALGADRILGLIMPSKNTKDEDIQDAKDLANQLNIDTTTINIADLEEQFESLLNYDKQIDRVAIGNILPRLRMTILYFHANSMNRLVAGTGNKSELLIGYFTKYGDGGVDMLPIGDLYKTQVRQLAEYLGISKNLIWKVPTAGLWENQTDENEIGFKYELLDLALYGLNELKLSISELTKELSISTSDAKIIMNMTVKNQHKLETPAIAKL
ncbi:MAG: NAD+ synthase [Candidatus Bathyarchaeota archaeon]|nr:NAD+ synthase [Candidatus Bathyarchaeota archaeon]